MGEWQRVPEDGAGEPESIWMMRGADGAVRFYAVGKGQVGKRHSHMVAAAMWAWGEGWLWCDPDGRIDLPLQLECRGWVANGGADALEPSR